MRLEHDTVNLYRAALLTDFGSITDYDEMSTNKFFSGDDGLDGLLVMFDTVVDSFPITDVRYAEYMSLFSGLAMILAEQIRNFKKVCFPPLYRVQTA